MKKIGIIGLPNAGKSTLFKALTEEEIDIDSYPFTTIEPNKAVIKVPDQRLEKLKEIVNPKEKKEALVEFVDIAGLVKEAHKGEGLGNKFLSHIAGVDLILQVVRSFKNKNIAHPYERLDPEADVEIINSELIQKDLNTLASRLEELEKEADSGSKTAQEDLKVLRSIKAKLKEEELLYERISPEEKEWAQKLNLLSAKPTIYLLNGPKDKELPDSRLTQLSLNIEEELQLQSLNSEEKEQLLDSLDFQSALDQTIEACYNELNLITFYTLKGHEKLSAWSIQKGTKAPKAGGKVHSDFEKDFIKAKVINCEKLFKAGAWKQAKNKGWIKTKGKDYEVKDGDVIEFII
jgi:hypothetical protein